MITMMVLTRNTGNTWYIKETRNTGNTWYIKVMITMMILTIIDNDRVLQESLWATWEVLVMMTRDVKKYDQWS